MGEVTACGICGGKELNEVLDLGEQPLAEGMGQNERYPLVLLECPECMLVQLSYIVDPEKVFPAAHPYTSGNTRALREHFSALAAKLSIELHQDDVIVDIGANDGSLLAAYPDEFTRIAVEPTNQAQKCRDQGFPTFQEFFTPELAKRIRATYGPAKLVTATNVLAHVPEPHSFAEGVGLLLGDDGVFVTENGDVASIFNGLQVDFIYHEHLRYYSVASLSRLLAMHGLWVTRSVPIDIHGGSFQVTAARQRGALSDRAEEAAIALHDLLEQLHEDGAVIYGIGAATRATPLIHYTNIWPYIDRVCEVKTSEKIGKLIPGTSIEVVDEECLVTDPPDYALLFPWHLVDSLVAKMTVAGYTGKYIVPLPEARIIGG